MFMNSRRNSFCLIIALIGVMLITAACSSSPKAGNEDMGDFLQADFIGIVYDSENRPCRGAVVRADGKDKYSSITDIDGRFVLPGLSRGNHTLRLSKDDFESRIVDLNFTSRKQVLYARLLSQSHLLDKAESSLNALEWKQAEEYLERARYIDEEDSRLLALEGAFFYRKSRYNEALERFLRLIEKGHRDSHLYLIIAEIQAFGLGYREKAILSLKQSLEYGENTSVRTLLEELTESDDPTDP